MECEYCKYEYSLSNISRHVKYYCKFNPNRIIKPKITCEYCMNEFSNKWSLKDHLAKYCKNKPKLLISNKKIDKCNSKTILRIKQKLNKPSDKQAYKQESASQVDKQESDKQVDKQESEANSKSDTGNLILDKIIDKLGKKELGLDYLIGNFLTKNYERIIEKSYLEDRGSDDYPFACKKQFHFRYYNKDNEMVDDIDGTSLSKTIHKGIQNAALTVSIIIIKKHIDGDNNEELYDNYDLAQLQSLVYKMSTDKSLTKIKKYLAKRVLNPNHPYFKAHYSSTNNELIY